MWVFKVYFCHFKFCVHTYSVSVLVYAHEFMCPQRPEELDPCGSWVIGAITEQYLLLTLALSLQPLLPRFKSISNCFFPSCLGMYNIHVCDASTCVSVGACMPKHVYTDERIFGRSEDNLGYRSLPSTLFAKGACFFIIYLCVYQASRLWWFHQD